MAKPISSLESHPMRQRIIAALAENKPLRDISSWADPAVTPMALSRFKRHSMDQILRAVTAAKESIANNDTELQRLDNTAVTKAALTIAADPFLSHIVKSSARRDRWIDLAENAEGGPDHRALASHDGNDLRALELHAKLAGRLTSTPLIAVQVVIPATGPARIEDDETGETIDIR